MDGTLLAAAENADEPHRRDDRPDALQKQEAPTLLCEGDHRQHGRADQVEEQVDERVLVEQAQLTEGEGGEDGHGSGELQDNDHGVGHLMVRYTTFAPTLAAGEVGGQQLDVLIAGDDEAAKQKVSQLASAGAAELARLNEILALAITTEELPPELPGVVELGDEVLVEFAADEVERFLLVDPVEAPLDDVRISVESPLAKAVLGRRVGEQVEVDAPSGRYRCRILATGRYRPGPASPADSSHGERR